MPTEVASKLHPFHRLERIQAREVDRLLPVPVESQEGEPSYFAEVSLDLPLYSPRAREVKF